MRTFIENVVTFKENMGAFIENVVLFKENVGAFIENVVLFDETLLFFAVHPRITRCDRPR
ncbi:MAG: hypothetical protein ACFE0I_15540 [Elainellaceae cyanobacterium]